MKRLFAYVLLPLLALSSSADTLTIRQLFVEMPDSVIPYLTRNNRLDFIDFMDSGMKAEVTNELGGKSQMTALADDALTVQLNEVVKVDLLLLSTRQPVGNCSQIVCMVKTFSLPGGGVDSTVDYYSAKWCRLEFAPSIEASDLQRLSKVMEPSSILKKMVERLNKD